MPKSRIFLYALVFFLAGVAIRSFVAVPLVVIWIGTVGVAAAAVIGILRKKSRLGLAALFIAALFFGIIRYTTVEHQKPDLSPWYGSSITAEGVVVEEPYTSADKTRFVIEVKSIGTGHLASSFQVLVTTRRFPQYSVGDRLRISGVLEEPKSFSDFDYAALLARDDIFATAAFPNIEILPGREVSLQTILSRLKHAFEEKINRVLPEPDASFLIGLLLGDRTNLPAGLAEDFKTTGTTHIVAVSGYNITIVGKFCMAMLALLTVPFGVSFWLATGAIILFVMLTGASASVVRAGIMGVLVLIAEREGRKYRMTTALACAAFLMVFANPLILRFDTSFQLSFLSTLGLIYVAPRLEKFFVRTRPLFPNSDHPFEQTWLGRLVSTLIETLSAQIAVLPLVVYLFGRVSVISPLTNILVLVAVPYTMASGFAVGVIGFLSGTASRVMGVVPWILLEYMLRIIHWLAGFPVAAISVGTWILAPIAIVYIGCFYMIWKKQKSISK